MKICVFGLWHLGSVTSACLASKGFNVVGLDFEEALIDSLKKGGPPVFEPGLSKLLQEGIHDRNLSFTRSPSEALHGASVLWVTFDTPVDDQDNADVEYVLKQIIKVYPNLEDNTVVLISSQLPVGTTSYLEKVYFQNSPFKNVSFAYSPENLRLGKAIELFNKPDRVIVGMHSQRAKEIISKICKPFNTSIVWMSAESAEMTKHSINAFLALSITFINEIAVICEKVGADAKEVELGLKSESRIGPKAYLKPGAAFAGGTLARDVAYLTSFAKDKGLSLHLLPSIRESNKEHESWIRRRLIEHFQSLENKTITILGLTYKPGTDTLRRSSAILLCYWLIEHKSKVKVFDPVVKTLPSDLASTIVISSSLDEAAKGSDAIVIATEWEDLKSLTANKVKTLMISPLVFDANRFLEMNLEKDLKNRYVTVGKSS